MPTKRTSKTTSSTKTASKTKSSTAKKTGPRKQDAMIIKMTPKQRDQLRKLTKGKVDAQTIQIRGDLDVSNFLNRLVELIRARPQTNGGFAPPPKDTYWV